MSKGISVVHFYGYYLGRPDEGDWRVVEADEYGSLPHRWATPDPEGSKGEADLMREALLGEAGFTDERFDDMSHFRQEEALAERCGVRVVWHGHLEYRDISLAAHGTVAESCDSRPMPAVRPLDDSAREQADRNLARALGVLGITPRQERPD